MLSGPEEEGRQKGESKDPAPWACAHWPGPPCGPPALQSHIYPLRSSSSLCCGMNSPKHLLFPRLCPQTLASYPCGPCAVHFFPLLESPGHAMSGSVPCPDPAAPTPELSFRHTQGRVTQTSHHDPRMTFTKSAAESRLTAQPECHRPRWPFCYSQKKSTQAAVSMLFLIILEFEPMRHSQEKT